jgi:hypothetical protein
LTLNKIVIGGLDNLTGGPFLWRKSGQHQHRGANADFAQTRNALQALSKPVL